MTYDDDFFTNSILDINYNSICKDSTDSKQNRAETAEIDNASHLNNNHAEDKNNKRNMCIEDWINKNPDIRRKEIDFLCGLSPEGQPSFSASGDIMKQVNISYDDKKWVFLVLIDAEFSKYDKLSPVRFYLVFPSVNEVKKINEKHFFDIKNDERGNAFVEPKNLKSEIDSCIYYGLRKPLVEIIYRHIKYWVKELADKSNAKIQYESSSLRGFRYVDGRKSMGFEPHKKCEKIVFSDRALTQIYNETHNRIKTETSGLLLGHYYNNTWYVVESSDPGYEDGEGIFRTSYHESDEKYVNHICGIISKTYKYPLTFLGMWHRHPGSLDTFSGTDDGTNIKYANTVGKGCISLLINVDPTFRITAYYVDILSNELKYIRTDIKTGNQYFENPDILKIASIPEIDERISKESRQPHRTETQAPHQKRPTASPQNILQENNDIEYLKNFMRNSKRAFKRHIKIIKRPIMYIKCEIENMEEHNNE